MEFRFIGTKASNIEYCSGLGAGFNVEKRNEFHLQGRITQHDPSTVLPEQLILKEPTVQRTVNEYIKLQTSSNSLLALGDFMLFCG
jgi:hypothetical protein